MRLLCVLVLSGALVAVSAPASSADTQDDYVKKIDAAIAAVQRARAASGPARQTAITQAIAALPLSLDVSAQGEHVIVRNDWLHEELLQNPPALDVALNRLLALRAAIVAPKRQTEFSAAQRDDLDRILNNPPFVSKPPTLWDRLGDLWYRILLRLLELLSELFAQGNLATSLIKGLFAFALAVFLGIVITNRVAGGLVTTAEEKARSSSAAPPLDAAATMRLAKRAANGGDFREATRLAFRASLIRLEERGIVQVRAAATNRELLRSARAATHPPSSLDELVVRFEQCWYGHGVTSAQSWLDYQTLVERMWSETA
jgi:hypothetical protein